MSSGVLDVFMTVKPAPVGGFVIGVGVGDILPSLFTIPSFGPNCFSSPPSLAT